MLAILMPRILHESCMWYSCCVIYSSIQTEVSLEDYSYMYLEQIFIKLAEVHHHDKVGVKIVRKGYRKISEVEQTDTEILIKNAIDR